MSYINILLLMLAFAAPANAQMPAPLAFSGTYQFTLAGIPFGEMHFSFNHKADHFDAATDLHTTGLARVFVQHDSHTTSQGTGVNFSYPDVSYESDYQTRKKKKYVKMVKKNGAMVEAVITPPDNRAVRPEVSKALQDQAYNPLAYGLQLRTEMTKCIETKCSSFSLNYFDGRRLTEGTFTPRGTKVIKIDGKKYVTYIVTSRRKPLEGFTQNELEDIPADEPPLTIYFSQDERLVPLKLDFPLAFGTASATLKL